MDSDIRTYTIRDPRSNSNYPGTMAAAAAAAATPQQMPPQVVVQPPPRPQVAPQPAKPGSSTDTEKVILLSTIQ